MDGIGLVIQAANLRLKNTRAGIRILMRPGSDRLYLRGTLPPKPGSGKVRPYQQFISLGIYANPAGVKAAEAAALDFGSKLALGQFDWGDLAKPDENETCESAIARFKAQWVAKQTGTPRAIEQRWKDQYWYSAYTQLPGHRPITPQLLETVLDICWATKPAARQKAAQKFGQLARFLKFETALTAGDYNVGHVSRDVPSDAEIERVVDAIAGCGRKGHEWQWVVGMMAVYGIRNHEAFHCDVSWEQIAGQRVLVCLVHETTKTGTREVLPLPVEWVSRWRLDEVRRPNVTEKWGDRSAKQFKRMRPKTGAQFRLYDLRHAWNQRALLAGIPLVTAAALMGHSTTTNEVYQRHLGKDRVRNSWAQVIG